MSRTPHTPPSLIQRILTALGLRPPPDHSPGQPTPDGLCPACHAPLGLTRQMLPQHLAPQLSRNHDGQPMLTIGPLRWINVGKDKWESVPVPADKGGRHAQ